MLMVILPGGADATTVGEVLSGSSVYINVGTYEQPSYLSNLSFLSKLSFTVTDVPLSKISEGAVSVKPVGPISGKLTIPSTIYVKVGSSYYPYGVTEIPAEAFKDQTGITDVLFERDPHYDYDLLTIGANAFSGTTGLTGTLVIPQTVTSIGDNAFAVETTVNILEVDMGSNATYPVDGLTFGTDVFKGRTITNLHIMGNFGTKVKASSEVFSSDNVTNVYYYGDGDTDGYYPFLEALASKNFGLPGKKLYLPADYIKTFVDKCTQYSHKEWIPETVNGLTFTHTTKDGKYELLLASNVNGGAKLAVHKAVLNSDVTNVKLNFNDDEWHLDLMNIETGQSPDITIIDSKAFADNDNLQSITIIPMESDDPITIKGDAFAGAKSLRYVDLSQRNTTEAGKLLNSKFSFSSGYTLTRIPTTENSSSTPPYQYTKSTGYLYELAGTAPFGGLPPYTLVFLPTGMTAYPTTTATTETVYKTDGTTATSLTRPLDENFILKNTDNTPAYSCKNFGVYEVSDLDEGKASDQNYTWYTFVNPYDFTAGKSTYYRQYTAGSAASVCLPFAVDAPKNGTLYTYKGIEGTKIVITPVTTPAAATPYFFIPTEKATLSSSQSQTIAAVTDPTTEKSENELHGVYTGKSFSKVSGTAYGMAGSQFTYNGKTYPAGTFVKFSSTAWLSPFRAYLLLSSPSGGAKSAVMEMVIDNTTTGITSISDAPAAHTPYYNIEGMKVESPSHGIYIHNGHKVIMK